MRMSQVHVSLTSELMTASSLLFSLDSELGCILRTSQTAYLARLESPDEPLLRLLMFWDRLSSKYSKPFVSASTCEVRWEVRRDCLFLLCSVASDLILGVLLYSVNQFQL